MENNTVTRKLTQLSLALAVLAGLGAAAATQALPAGWTKAERTVKAAAPEADREVTVTYFRAPLRMQGPDLKPLEFVQIPAGEVRLGAGDAQRVLKLEKPLLIGAYEVTQAQYKAVMDKNPSHYRQTNGPVEKVPWKDAQEFCSRLSKQGKVIYRLPTEAEWEYACRAGSTTRYYWGAAMRDDACWWGGNRGGRTHPVGEKLPNAFGLYDMAGNALEWAACKPNPEREGSEREGYVLRSGPLQEGDWSLVSDFRYSYPNTYDTFNGIGLRLVAEWPAEEKP